jgi:hypothetical protein
MALRFYPFLWSDGGANKEADGKRRGRWTVVVIIPGIVIRRLKTLLPLVLAVAVGLCRASMSMAAEEAATETDANIAARLGALVHGLASQAVTLWQSIWAAIKGVDGDVWVAIFTGVLAVVTSLLAWLAWCQWFGYRSGERAYVTLSHYSDRGVPALQLDLDGRVAMVTVRVKNFGNTPATIRRVSLALRVSRDRLPRRPRYGPPDDDIGFFLVKGDHFDVTPSLAISAEEAERIVDGAPVWLLGYVDYRDAFRRRYRAGYARRYDPDPASGADNLTFETQRGYNYDRRRRWW